MHEKIGNVKVNLDYYNEIDFYTDGIIEDELLYIVKKYDDYETVINSDNRWPILYHLSRFRANILEWFPFDKSKNILEIGAGCGAITSLLTERCSNVTCVELSKKRALINAFRNKKCTNLEILVGDFNEIEYSREYDYITLIGVLEYSNSFSKSNNPPQEFLKNVQKLLKPNGKLFIAIENRFGLKYWAGAREDHTGEFFDSIENYNRNKHIQTFSKNELSNLLNSAGFNKIEFFYPIPDYKFPFQIFSDEKLPKIGQVRDLIHNFDNNRLNLFDESNVLDSLIENNQFPFFSNSFLVICEI